ncbi:MAG TPA: universal stress protein [Chroococcales cyanobacterium]
MNILLAIQDRTLIDELIVFLERNPWADGAVFNVIHVVEPPYASYYLDLERHQKEHQLAGELLQDTCVAIRKVHPSALVRTMVLEGEIKDEIVRAAKSMPADLLIMGTHNRGWLGKTFLGSISLGAQTSAPCSVLILRDKKQFHQESNAGKRERPPGSRVNH